MGASGANPGPAEWHAAAKALADKESATPADQMSLYSHFHGVNTTHPASGTGAAGSEAAPHGMEVSLKNGHRRSVIFTGWFSPFG